MAWENSRQLLPRARSKQISENLWRIDWNGSQFILKGPGPKWRIRHLTTNHLHLFIEEEGLGKEEAIAWIEANF